MSEWKDKIHTSICNDSYNTGWISIDQIVNKIKNLRLKRQSKKKARQNNKNLKG